MPRIRRPLMVPRKPRSEEEWNIVDEVLATCDGSTTLLAKRLTEAANGKYYSPQAVTYWRDTGNIPATHLQVVAKVSGIPLSRLSPELYGTLDDSEGGESE